MLLPNTTRTSLLTASALWFHILAFPLLASSNQGESRYQPLAPCKSLLRADWEYYTWVHTLLAEKPTQGSFRAEVYVFPAFESEYVLRISEIGKTTTNKPHYLLTYVVSEMNIYIALSNTKPPFSTVDSTNLAIRSKVLEASLSEETGSTVLDSWQRVLWETRQTRGLLHMKDGVRYEFSVFLPEHGIICGEANITYGPPASTLYDMTEILVEYCQSPDSQKPELRRKLREKANQAIKEVELMRTSEPESGSLRPKPRQANSGTGDSIGADDKHD